MKSCLWKGMLATAIVSPALRGAALAQSTDHEGKIDKSRRFKPVDTFDRFARRDRAWHHSSLGDEQLRGDKLDGASRSICRTPLISFNLFSTQRDTDGLLRLSTAVGWNERPGASHAPEYPAATQNQSRRGNT